jgi:nicotinamidase-related amidase
MGSRHDSTLPQWAVDKMTRRRGRRHAFENLVARQTALVVIDLMQTYVVSTPCAAAIIGPINRLASMMREVGGTVAWVYPSAVSQIDPILSAIWGPQHLAEIATNSAADSPMNRPPSGLVRDNSDITVQKRAYSAFFPGRCALPDLLRERGIDTVVIAGVLTNICCESSARDAATLGFRVIMAADANAARSDAEHQSALYNILRNFGDVRLTDDLIGALRGSHATA